MRCKYTISLPPITKKNSPRIGYVGAHCPVCHKGKYANLSPRTIAHVQKALAEAVLPKLDGIYTPENKKQLDNVQNVADADLWVKAYLTDHGVQVWAAKEKSK